MIASRRNVPHDVPEIDIVQQSTLWRGLPDAEAAVRDAVAAAANLCDTVPVGSELAVILTDDESIRALNKQWRGIDRPTNVLSFPAPQEPAPAEAPQMLGDIVIAYQYLRREAELEGKPPLAHLAHLVVHGFLHLLGYDHETDAEAGLMEGLEARILATLGLSDPYANRDRVRAIHPR